MRHRHSSVEMSKTLLEVAEIFLVLLNRVDGPG